MSRRKQARPKHVTTSNEELDRELSKSDDINRMKSHTNVKKNYKLAANKVDHNTLKCDKLLTDRALTTTTEADLGNDENFNNGYHTKVVVDNVLKSNNKKQRFSADKQVPLKWRSTTAKNGHSPKSLYGCVQEARQLKNGRPDVANNNKKKKALTVGPSSSRSGQCSSPLRSNYNVNLSIAATMKNHSTFSGLGSHSGSTKNLCDKCGGTYATLAALISHKKSCKGTLNRRRAAPVENHFHLQSELLRATLAKAAESDSENGEEMMISNADEDGGGHAGQLVSSQSTEHSLKFMSDAMAAAAAAAALGGHSSGQWPTEHMGVPFANPATDMGALFESFGPLFAHNNFERNGNTSPTPEEQQAALITQQMMLLHMLQQLQAGASQIPALPFLAAAAAAAAAQQQQQQQPLTVSQPEVKCTDNVADNSEKLKDEQAAERLSRFSNLQRISNSSSTADNVVKTQENPNEDKEEDPPKRPPSASSPSAKSNNSQQPSIARKYLSSLLDLKDTNLDVPLPPMMSPPKTDSAEPFNEPNTLELLQKHTEQALQNTMSGGSFLLNGSSDSSDLLHFRKNKDGKEDPANRHRCRYCGKVFGSDSALQIHIRSHTGERPFKCNVCGNRFTTKGNLKVHFQRHKAKYPHVKMNPHPVPEHLDKFHPPLEPPSNSQSPPPSSTGLFPSSSSNFASSFHIPAIFSSTLIPFASEENVKLDTSKSSDEKVNKSKERGLFDLSDLYKNTPEPKTNGQFSCSMSSATKSVHSESSQSECEEQTSFTVKQARSFTEEDSDDTDVESNEHVVNLRKKGVDKDNEEEEEAENLEDLEEKSELSEVASVGEHSKDKHQEEEEEEEEADSRLDMDSNSEITDDDLTQYGISGSSLPSSFGLLGLPFGVDLANMSASQTNALPTAALNAASGAPPPDQTFSARSESDCELPEVAVKDPIFYQSLLPKPGSADSAWETLMEVQKASETSKLQQLVDNIEHKLKDPNQCFFCKRVLSCKSALQMHYRTHTGERPFKCKICGRAFTTKGNLKTHMGVHRVKPPLRMMHQCPICHKQFTNALVLQQHIRTHAGESGNSQAAADASSELLAELKNNSFLSTSFPRAFLPHTFGNPFVIGPSQVGPSLFPSALLPEIAAQQLSKSTPFGAFAASLQKEVAVNNNDSSENNSAKQNDDVQVNENSGISKEKKRRTPPKIRLDESGNSDATDIEDEIDLSPAKLKKKEEKVVPLGNGSSKLTTKTENTLNALESHVMKSTSLATSASSKPLFVSTTNSTAVTTPTTEKTLAALDLTPKSSQSESSPLPSQPSPTSSNESRGYGPGGTPYPGVQFHPTGRPNTTCRICFKTFACFSALEIHIRSHTKERPFKCEVCDRGFSTKGNMKQHMLTHKIRDLPPDLYTTVSPPANTTLGNFLTSNNLSKILKKSTTSSSTNSNNSSRVSSPQTPNGHNSNSMDSDKGCNSDSGEPNASNSSNRTPGSSKHLCTICNKPFSSGSALQIHMRTHTGDKPFKCTICGRAFTTKGNLKVHMGTHMWNTNPSRRGRRMSIDLHASLQISPPGMSSTSNQIATGSNQSEPSPTVSSSNQSNNPSGDISFLPTHFLPSHFLNGSEASQLAMQQMMLMKMMSANQTSPLSSIQATLSDKAMSSNGEKESVYSVNSEADTTNEMKESECDQIEVKCKSIKHDSEPNSPLMKEEESTEDDNKSVRSEQSNHESSWLSKEWKVPCTICNHVSDSPAEFEQHIKGHFQVATTVRPSSSEEDKTPTNAATTTTARVFSV